MALFTVALGWVLLDNEKLAQKTAVLNVARALGGAVAAEIQRSISALEILALSDHLSKRNLEGFATRLHQARSVHGSWANVSVFSAGGTLLGNANTMWGAAQPQIPKIEEVVHVSRTRRPLITNLRVNVVTGKPYIGVAVPVIRDGECRYVLWAQLDSSQWSAFLKARIPDKWSGAIDDRNGIIVARSDHVEVVGRYAAGPVRDAYMKQQEGVIDVVGATGQHVIAGFHRLEASGFTVLAVAPVDILLGASAQTRVAWLLIAMSIVVTFALILARWTLTPVNGALERMRAGMPRISDGIMFSAQRSGVREIDEVMKAANESAVAIQERNSRVSELQAQLVARAASAEHANSMKDRFIAMLGHEIRNPLAGIANAAQVLQRLSTDPAGQRMADVVKRQTEHLTVVVSDLLDISKLATGKLKLSRAPVELDQVIHDAVGTLVNSGRFEGRTLSVDCPPGMHVSGDFSRLYQVFSNVLDNAAKFTTEGGSITVGVAQASDFATVTVTDTGRGISSEALARVFQPFEQEEQALHRPTGGLGLGLTIARHIVELHDGRIDVHSAGVGKGSVVAVTLPLLLGSTPASVTSELRQ